MTEEKKSNISQGEYLDLFEKAMLKLAMAVDREMGEERILIYFEQLHVYSIEEIQVAVNQAIHDEEFSVIPPVGKLIRIIEDARKEKGERWPALRLEHFEKWPEITNERVKELIQPFYDKLNKIEEELSPEEREERWKRNREKLKVQGNLVRRNAEPVEPT